MKIEVTEIQDMGEGNLRCYAAVKIGPLTIYKLRLIKQPGQKAYVSPPQFEYFANGRVNYTPVLKWPNEWNQPILEAVWAAYQQGRNTDE